MNNDTRIRIPYKMDDLYRLLICIDYDPSKIVYTGISTTPEEAVSGSYVDYADTIKSIIAAYSEGNAHSFEYIASGNRIDHENQTVTIIGLSSSGGTGHDTNIYQVTGSITGNGVLRLLLREDYSGNSYQAAINAFNSGNIPTYMQPMVSMYNYRYSAYKKITSWNNFISNEPWVNNISTLKWLRSLDISYITDISSLAKESTLITTDEGLEVFANHPLIDIESIFAMCNLEKVSHMNNYILPPYGSTDAIKSMFYDCPKLTYLELIGWDISTDITYLSMFMSSAYGQDFMCGPGKTYTLKVDENMKEVMMKFYGNGAAGNNTTEAIIYGLLSNAAPVDGVYTIVHTVPEE